MPNHHCYHPLDATQAFMHYVAECYRMGKRLHERPLFREAHVRKYKKKCRAEFIRSHYEPSAISGNRLTADTDAVPHLGRYVDDSMVHNHPYGSEKDTFFHSWPSKVTLKPADGRVKWSTEVSGHCPFCAPSGKVNTLKELVDHLSTHHPNFTYKAHRNHCCAVINMKINSSREDNVDPMYIVGSEGYMLSPKWRMNAPRYCRVPQRGDACYPFVFRRFRVPPEYGGYIPGAPGTIDAEVNYVQPDADFAKAPGLYSNNSNVRAKSKRMQSCDSNPLKRRIRNDPRGMRNRHTIHMRAKMFGDFARDRKAGAGEKPVMNQDATDGHLFHTSTNIPLDVTRYNDGFDSDNDAEDETLRSVLKSNELQMNEFIDVPALEKYFFTLWDRFINKEVTVRHDKVVFPTLMRFVERFGDQIRDMNLEVNLSSMVAHFWELGLLDADGVLIVMQSYREHIAMEVVNENAPRNETDLTNDVEHLYQSFEGISFGKQACLSHSIASFGMLQERTLVNDAFGSNVCDAWVADMYNAENLIQQN